MTDRELLEKIAGHIQILNDEHLDMASWRSELDAWRSRVDDRVRWIERAAWIGALTGAAKIAFEMAVLNGTGV
jgi:hypothetical protein